MKSLACFGVLFVLSAATSADAWVFRSRFVERIGNTEVVLINDNILHAVDHGVHNIRLQFGVFDDGAGPAPDGGFVGWNVGSLVVNAVGFNSDERRNPGRLSPYNFAGGVNSNGNPPLPAGDPFTYLTEIDATLGTQSPLWTCDPHGIVPEQPMAAVRGRNTFVSVFAFSVDPNEGSYDYTITASGNLIAATSWLPVGNPTPPDCGDPADPLDDIPGSVTFAPYPTTPQGFTNVLSVYVGLPAPGSAALLSLACLFVTRRRR